MNDSPLAERVNVKVCAGGETGGGLAARSPRACARGFHVRDIQAPGASRGTARAVPSRVAMAIGAAVVSASGAGGRRGRVAWLVVWWATRSPRACARGFLVGCRVVYVCIYSGNAVPHGFHARSPRDLFHLDHVRLLVTGGCPWLDGQGRSDQNPESSPGHPCQCLPARQSGQALAMSARACGGHHSPALRYARLAPSRRRMPKPARARRTHGEHGLASPRLSATEGLGRAEPARPRHNGHTRLVTRV